MLVNKHDIQTNSMLQKYSPSSSEDFPTYKSCPRVIQQLVNQRKRQGFYGSGMAVVEDQRSQREEEVEDFFYFSQTSLFLSLLAITQLDQKDLGSKSTGGMALYKLKREAQIKTYTYFLLVFFIIKVNNIKQTKRKLFIFCSLAFSWCHVQHFCQQVTL